MHHHINFLTHPYLYHTQILSFYFRFACYRPSRLQQASFFLVILETCSGSKLASHIQLTTCMLASCIPFKKEHHQQGSCLVCRTSVHTQQFSKKARRMNKIKILTFGFIKLENGQPNIQSRFLKQNNQVILSVSFHSCALWSCSYTLCTRGHFEPSPPLLQKYYYTS